MAKTTSDESQMSREEAASFLRSIADGLESDDSVLEVPVGNKTVQLSPQDRFDAETTVYERSRRLRKDTEELTIKFKWNPVHDTAEAEQ